MLKNVHTLKDLPPSHTTTEPSNGPANGQGSNTHKQILLRQECSGRTFEIYLDQSHASLQARFCEGDTFKPATIRGIEGRKMELTEQDTVETVRSSLEKASISAQENDITIVLLEDENEELRGLELSEILSGIKGTRDPKKANHYAMELDRRFEEYERWAKSSDSRNLCNARNNFLELATEENMAVFIRAMNGLIYALEKDQGHADTSDNLKNICEKLWERLEGFTGGSVTRLEKLTQAFGLSLDGLIKHYDAGYLTTLRRKKGDSIDLRTKIYQEAKALRKLVTKKCKDLRVQYHLTFIKEAAKMLETPVARRWRIGGRIAQSVAKVGNAALGQVGGGTGGVEVNAAIVYEVPVAIYKEIAKLAADPDFHPRRGWYKTVSKTQKSFTIDLDTYRSYVKTPEDRKKITTWQWHYAIIGYIKDVLKYSKESALVEAAKNDLESYLYKETSEENKKRLYHVLYELVKSENLEADKRGFCEALLNGLHAIDNKLRSYPETSQFIQSFDLENESVCYWSKWQDLREWFKDTAHDETQRAILDQKVLPVPTDPKEFTIFISHDSSVKSEVVKIQEDLQTEFSKGSHANCLVRFGEAPRLEAAWSEKRKQFIMEEPDLIVLYITREYFKNASAISQLLKAEDTLGKNKFTNKIRILYDGDMSEVRKNRKERLLYGKECVQFWKSEYSELEEIYGDLDPISQISCASEREYLYRNQIGAADFMTKVFSSPDYLTEVSALKAEIQSAIASKVEAEKKK